MFTALNFIDRIDSAGGLAPILTVAATVAAILSLCFAVVFIVDRIIGVRRRAALMRALRSDPDAVEADYAASGARADVFSRLMLTFAGVTLVLVLLSRIA